jgi:hypothetical protein
MKNEIVKVSKDGGLQGDLMLIRIDKLPKGAQKAKTNILALGEVTGHNHAILDADVYVIGDLQFVVAEEPATLVHGGRDVETDFDHFKQVYEPGIYAVIRQTEWNRGEERRVID